MQQKCPVREHCELSRKEHQTSNLRVGSSNLSERAKNISKNSQLADEIGSTLSTSGFVSTVCQQMWVAPRGPRRETEMKAKFPIEIRATSTLGEAILYLLRFAIKATIIATLAWYFFRYVMLP
jgi:hypothetical protein